ncbi:TULIP family P47-like protein [Paraburkholderia sp. CNPSo 3155]|uniref:TULIP family P47-like protein n=1 Tax=Paraburkholderia TaxID=1822464 RepID=UPI00128BF6B9|nr:MULTISPECIES: TULIP family P47-like protein [Paraburkholderia]MPW11543.1 TULIP family P47-like protein [Paraburkholderia atlantica]NUY35989.1 TULIP family P47-like protein [Paraburkholderia atlantica]
MAGTWSSPPVRACSTRRSPGERKAWARRSPNRNGAVTVKGSLSICQIATGGSGALVKFLIPCSTLTLSQKEQSFTLTDGSFLVKATLALAPPPDPADSDARARTIKAGKGTLHRAVIELRRSAIRGFEVMAVTVLQSWLDAQASFPYTLVAIKLTIVSDRGPVAALVPVSASYAYADAADGDGVLALLCRVAAGADNAGQLLPEVNPSALGGGASAMLLGKDVVLRLADLALSRVSWPGAGAARGQFTSALLIPVELTEGV